MDLGIIYVKFYMARENRKKQAVACWLILERGPHMSNRITLRTTNPDSLFNLTKFHSHQVDESHLFNANDDVVTYVSIEILGSMHCLPYITKSVDEDRCFCTFIFDLRMEISFIEFAIAE